jgi:magnesium transporter
MIKQLKYQSVTWLDIESPTEAEINSTAREYGIHPSLIHELKTPSLRSRIDLFDNYIYLVLHFPSQEAGEIDEVDFVIGKEFIITAHYTPVKSLQELAKILADNKVPTKKSQETQAGDLFFHIIRHLYESLEPGLDTIGRDLHQAGQEMTISKDRESVLALANINYRLLNFSWSLKEHRSVLESLELAGKEFFGEKYSFYLRAIIGGYEKIWSKVENNKEYSQELKNIDSTLLAIKTNNSSRRLTLLATLGLPALITASIFNSQSFGFSLVLLLVALVTGLTYLLFKRKQWF